jgi:lipopolysaccharide heptosyltransferase II
MKEVPDGFSPARILVIQLRQIGDALLATPAVRALRRRFPEARICFLAEPLPAKVLAGNPDIDEVMVRDPGEGALGSIGLIRRVRAGRFDLVVDFLANPRTAMIAYLSGAGVTVSYSGNRRSFLYTHPVEPEGVFSGAQKLSLLRALGVDPGAESMDLEMAVPDAAIEKINQWIKEKSLENASGPLVCIEPFMKYEALTWPAGHFIKLCETMAEKWGATAIVCWGPGREDEAKKIVESANVKLLLAPPTDLHELAALYQRADLWVGVDGGPRHIAAGQGIPTFAIHGPSDDAWTPPGARHTSVYKSGLSCVPCNRRHCPEEHNDCMKEFSPAEVFEKLEEFLRSILKTTDEHR